MAIAALPTPTPTREQTEEVFVPAMNAFLGALPGFVSGANALAVEVNDNSDAASSAASSAASNAVIAQSAAGAAVAASGATVWVSGASYTANTSAAISPVDQQTYRAKTTHSGLTLDPANDPANWTPVGITSAALEEAESRARHFSLIAAASF